MHLKLHLDVAIMGKRTISPFLFRTQHDESQDMSRELYEIEFSWRHLMLRKLYNHWCYYHIYLLLQRALLLTLQAMGSWEIELLCNLNNFSFAQQITNFCGRYFKSKNFLMSWRRFEKCRKIFWFSPSVLRRSWRRTQDKQSKARENESITLYSRWWSKMNGFDNSSYSDELCFSSKNTDSKRIEFER